MLNLAANAVSNVHKQGIASLAEGRGDGVVNPKPAEFVQSVSAEYSKG